MIDFRFRIMVFFVGDRKYKEGVILIPELFSVVVDWQLTTTTKKDLILLDNSVCLRRFVAIYAHNVKPFQSQSRVAALLH